MLALFRRPPSTALPFPAGSTAASTPLSGADDPLFDRLPDPALLLDANGQIMRCNPAAQRMFAGGRSRLEGVALRAIVSRADRAALDEQLRAARRATVRTDARARIHGQPRVLAFTVSGTPDGAWIVTARDVTDDRAAHERLTQSESRYRNLFEAASDAIMTFDALGRFTTVNGAAEQISGYTCGELIGRFFGPLLAPEAMPRALLEFRRALSGAAGQFETTMLHKSGERRHLTVNYACPERSREVICMIRDATAEKQLQQQLIQSEKMAAIGQLVSGVAHELNNPLASISAFAQLLLADTALSSEQRHSTEVVRSEAKRASRIVHNLLTFARQHKAEKVPADINSVVNDTLELRVYELNVRGIHVLRELEADAPVTMVDVHQLQQVVLNLITNAEQAMGELPPAARRHRLTIRTRTLPDVVRLDVEDTGPGIPESAMHQLFVPFFTTKATGKGTGLGLSISLGIVSEHGGRIWAENTAEGARFSVELPRVSCQAPPRLTMVQSTPQPRRDSLRILVADDEEPLRGALDRFLSAKGHSVVAVGSGSEAIWRAEGEEEFDAVLLDLRMPDMSGQQVFERWSTSAPRLSERVVFITGDIVSPDLQSFLTGTGRPYLAKPFDFAQVMDVLPRRRSSRSPSLGHG